MPADQRIVVDGLDYVDDGIIHVTRRFGYMETPDTPSTLAMLDPAQTEWPLHLDRASCFLSKIEVRRGRVPTNAAWHARTIWTLVSREDVFGHRSVAQQLARTVKGTMHSLAVGLIGPFVSGKSSVARLLTTEVAVNPDWAVLHVSAEHHSGVARTHNCDGRAGSFRRS